LAWQSYGDEIREFVAKSYPQLGWVAPETAFPKAAPEMAPIIPSAASPDKQEFEGMSVALAAVQQRVNRLAAKFVTSQEQMISDIAKLKVDERVILANLSSGTFTPASRSPAPVFRIWFWIAAARGAAIGSTQFASDRSKPPLVRKMRARACSRFF
jgi:hypothetical protein